MLVIGKQIGVVAGMERHVGAVDMLDRQDVERHRRGLVAGREQRLVT